MMVKRFVSTNSYKVTCWDDENATL